GSIVADPLNPKVIYAGGPAAGIVKITYPSGQWINVSPNIVTTDSLRKVGNQPLIFSPSNPRELFTGFQYLMSTVDGGMHWSKLGGDLTYPKGVTPPPPTATPTPRPAGSPGPAVPPPGSIESIAPSSVSSGTIWVGTNNGLIKVTTDHGRTWTDVTIPDLPNPTRADISAIDASHHDAATAYVAIDTHAVADYRPSLYRTHDYGKTWTKIVNGLATSQPSGSFTRVIRADTKKKGLLFAGSESSIYVSFDDGDNWQSLMLNLPNTSYRDLTIHENDLIAGTYGRGMWILDDISPLRQLTKTIAAEAAHLFKPGDAIRVRRNVNGDTPFPPEVPQAKNPPVGALIDYSLSTRPSTEITLDILDAAGTIVRHLSSAPIAPFNEPPPTVNDFWLEKPAPMPMTPGMHRIHWDIRHESPKAFTHSYEINANPDETPASPEGALALPGTYTLRLTVDGKSQTQTLVVRNDPRSPATLADLKAQHDLQMKIDALASTAWDGHSEVNALRASVAEITKGKPSDVVTAAVKALDEKLASVGGSSTPRRGGGGGGFPGAGAPPPPPNFAALQGTFIRQLGTLDPGDMAPNEPMLRVYGVACRDLKTAISTWKTVSGENLTAFNEVLVKNGLKPVPAGVSSLRSPVCPAAEAKPVK
ncbi:MAG: hypothetical protein ABI672_20935, partial [Vicinamibacteria bacterium]